MFSIVLPAFNAEKTIEKTINSILQNKTNQEYEIIIVNDGSTDGTKGVLQKYESDSRFKIVHQENAGVSAARNRALNELSNDSSYVLFIDDSDTISNNYIEEHMKVLEKYPDISISIAPITLEKEKKRSPQSLNFRFVIDKDKVNVDDEPTFVQYHLGGTVFRSNIFKENKKRFAEDLKFWEDALLINSVILNDKMYGLVKNAEYIYDRNNTNSLSRNAWADKKRYTYHIKNAYLPLIEKSQELYGEVIPYIQFLIARHYLQYLMEHNQESIQASSEFIDEKFMNYTKKVLTYIDLKTIEELDCKMSFKIFLMQQKGIKADLSNEYRKIKVLIQKIDFIKRRLMFTFSLEAAGLPVDSVVYVGNKRKDSAKIFEHRQCYLLGKETHGDITDNKYIIPIRASMLIKSVKIHIKNVEGHFIVENPAIIKRIIKKLKVTK